MVKDSIAVGIHASLPSFGRNFVNRVSELFDGRIWNVLHVSYTADFLSKVKKFFAVSTPTCYVHT
jgi:hypothetical protein